MIGVALAALALTVIAGWMLHSRVLVQVLPTFAPMQFNTALCFLALGMALIAIAYRRVAAVAWLTGAVILLGAITSLQYVIGANFGVDRWFVGLLAGLDAAHAGRMAPLAALCFVLAAGGLLSISLARTGGGVALVCGGAATSTAFAIALVTMLGYVADVQVSYIFSQSARMAQPTALAFVVTCSSALVLAWGRSESMAPIRWFPLTLGISLVLVLGWVSFQAQMSFQDATKERLRAEQVRGRLFDLEFHVIEAQGGGRGYGVAGVSSLKAIYDAGRTSVSDRIGAIERLMDGDARRSAKLTEVKAATAALFGWYDRLHALRAREGGEAAVALVETREGEALAARFKQSVDALARDLDLRTGDAVLAAQVRSLQILRMSAGLVTLLLVVGTGWLAQRELHARHASETELGRVSERLKIATEGAGVGIWEWNLTDDTLTWDDSMFALYGVAREDFTNVFGAWAARVVPEDLAPVMASVNGAIESRAPLDMTFRIVRPDGDVRHVRASGVLQFDEGGRPVRIIGTNWDMTALMRAEEGLRDMAFRAEAASRAKSNFLAAMSHEIRTPMNGVLGFTSLLLDTPLRDDQQDYVHTIRSSGETLLMLINDILDFSKIEADRLELERLTFELRPALEECVKLLQPKAAEKGLRLDVVMDEDLPLRVAGDCGRIRQIVLNLLSNAIKFTHQGGVRLKASHLGTADGLSRIALEVSDTGIGIPQDKIARLFQPFMQVDASTSRNYGGSGLGLAISRRLAEAMGGAIAVETVAGTGSTFTVTLALEAISDASTETPEERPSTRTLPGAESPLRVLVAEDTPVNQRLIVAFLQRLGCRADVVADGVEALEILARRDYDVILMDVHMPRLDGLDATRRIRSELPPERQPHVIAVTASVMNEETEACARAGMDQFIAKPIAIDALQKALANAADQRERRRQATKWGDEPGKAPGDTLLKSA